MIEAYREGTPRRQALWVAAQERGSFTAHDLAAALSAELRTVRATLNEWVADGRLRLTGEERHRRTVFEVVARPARRAPPAQTLEGNLWRAARLMKSFSAPLLAAHAATDQQSVSEDEAQKFCRMLMRGGYLRVLQTSVPGKRSAVYRLVRETGPLPPVERRVSTVWDANLGEYTHLPGPRS